MMNGQDGSIQLIHHGIRFGVEMMNDQDGSPLLIQHGTSFLIKNDE